MEHVLLGDIVAVRRVVDLHTRLAYYEMTNAGSPARVAARKGMFGAAPPDQAAGQRSPTTGTSVRLLAHHANSRKGLDRTDVPHFSMTFWPPTFLGGGHRRLRCGAVVVVA